MTNEDIKQYVKTVKVEYFDDRFYKIELPANFNLEKFKYPNLLSEDQLSIYLPSVTTYLSSIQDPFLIRWRGDVGNLLADHKMNEGAALGSSIHLAISKRTEGYDVIYNDVKSPCLSDAIIKQYADEVNPRIHIVNSQKVAIQLARFEKVMELFEPEILHSEHTVYNIKNLYAGTLDQVWKLKKDVTFKQGNTVVEYKKGKYIIDFKTGKSINEKSYFAQMAAYMNTDNMSYFKGAIIIHLNSDLKSGIQGFKSYFKTKQQLTEYYKYFLRVRDNYLYDNKLKPVDYEIPVFFNNSLNIKIK